MRYVIVLLILRCTVAKNVNHYHYNHFTAFWILSGTTRVSRHQKGKTNLDFTEARVAVASAWLCANLHLAHTDNHTSTPTLSFYRQYALPAAQPTASKH